MADVTVSQFAQVLKVPVDRLIVQLDEQVHVQVGHGAGNHGQQRDTTYGCPPDPAVCCAVHRSCAE